MKHAIRFVGRVSCWLPALAAIAACLILSGCARNTQAASEPVVRLNALQPLPAVPPASIAPLRVAVAAVISPKGNAESYGPLLDYLAKRLYRPVEMVQRRTYSDVNELLRSGDVDVAFVCTSAYLAGQRDFGMQLLLAPRVNGQMVYYSYLVVPAASAARSISDLRGKVFAFTDPMSLTGRVYPNYLVRQLGTDPEHFFERTFFTYSHDDAIRSVVDGLADGTAVDSLVYDSAVARDLSLAAKVKVIHRSPAFGIPPVVIAPDTRPQIRAEIYSALISMSEDSAGRAILQGLGIDGFVPADDTLYDSARRLVEEAGP
jgi:phosphonate transport system substrate-binding protein